MATEAQQPDQAQQEQVQEDKPYSGHETYDTRAFGQFGWDFVNAGELYRKLKNVSKEDALMMCGIFKQATLGDCEVEEPKKGDVEINQRNEWLKHKGTDQIAAMEMYIEKVKELSKSYELREETVEEEAA